MNMADDPTSPAAGDASAQTTTATDPAPAAPAPVPLAAQIMAALAGEASQADVMKALGTTVDALGARVTALETTLGAISPEAVAAVATVAQDIADVKKRIWG
jgi:hypothetical protein